MNVRSLIEILRYTRPNAPIRVLIDGAEAPFISGGPIVSHELAGTADAFVAINVRAPIVKSSTTNGPQQPTPCQQQQARVTSGTNACDQCGAVFSDANPCCCDHATFEDGTHDEGYCATCCPNPHSRAYSWPTYERMDCDQ